MPSLTSLVCSLMICHSPKAIFLSYWRASEWHVYTIRNAHLQCISHHLCCTLVQFLQLLRVAAGVTSVGCICVVCSKMSRSK